jgi:hypothetical protein
MESQHTQDYGADEDQEVNEHVQLLYDEMIQEFQLESMNEQDRLQVHEQVLARAQQDAYM